jgi:hypothetical protein
MLRDLRRRASEALSTACQIVLSTSGPAGVQADVLACEAIGPRLFVLVPLTSDLLFNVETDPSVVATADGWQVRGTARVLRPEEFPASGSLSSRPDARWCALLEVRPTRIHLRSAGGGSTIETIDL